MARTKRKQKPVEVYTYSALDEVLASPMEPTPEKSRVHQLTRMWGGLASIENAPDPTTDDWRVCSDAVNLLETLVTRGNVYTKDSADPEILIEQPGWWIGCNGSHVHVEDTSGLLQDAVTALAMAGKRHHTHGVIRLDAQGIQAVRAVLEDYAACLEHLPSRVMIRCHRLTERRIREIMKGRRKPHDV